MGDEFGVDLLGLLLEREEQALLGDAIDEPGDSAGGQSQGLHGLGKKEFGRSSGLLQAEGEIGLDLVGMEGTESDAQDEALGQGFVDGQAEMGFELRMPGQDQGQIVAGILVEAGQETEFIEEGARKKMGLVDLCGAPHKSTHGKRLVMWSARRKDASLLGSATRQLHITKARIQSASSQARTVASVRHAATVGSTMTTGRAFERASRLVSRSTAA